ncbi:MAG: aromatic aminobenezylarsenical efflux permease ArsG family transporter [Candidatus Omnitrophota bacterium]
MIELLLVFGTALWLGVLTSISPCPLATNIAAVSFLSRKINHPKAVFSAGLAYAAGRMSAYAVLGMVIITSLVSVSFIANFLQKYMNRILGPVLIVAGLFLLDIIRVNFSGISVSKERQELLAQSGLRGAFVLGVLFALAFCPISAALFFGSLIPLSLNNASYGIVLPLIYGIGTGMPVFMFALAIALGVTSLSRWFNKITKLEHYTRRITGGIFILTGLYYAVIYILKAF